MFEKRAMENYLSSVYRQTESWLERFKTCGLMTILP